MKIFHLFDEKTGRTVCGISGTQTHIAETIQSMNCKKCRGKIEPNDIVEVRYEDAISERGIVVNRIAGYNEYDIFFPDRKQRGIRLDSVGKDQITVISHLDISGVKLEGGKL